MDDNVMNYNETMTYITNACKFGMNFGLDRTERILELLGNPHKKIKFVHVGGTNGKGSTTSMLNSVLIKAGYKVGMYTSPYLEVFEERIQINKQNISKEKLAETVSMVKVAVDKVREEGLGEPTEFEIITCTMFLYFFNEKVDIGIIEVGLGGTLDSTNVISPILSIITSISYDHVNILGNTLSEIAGEKAGILKNNVPLVLYPQQEEAKEVIYKKANEKSVDITEVNINEGGFISLQDDGKKITQVVKWRDLEYELQLLGEHQIYNSFVVLNAISILKDKLGFNISEEQIKIGLKETVWIGRLEIMRREPTVVIDGAHNIDGINKLRSNIDKYFKYKDVYLVLGILSDKEVNKMVEVITPIAKEVITVTPHSERAELASELKEHVKMINSNVVSFDEYVNAYEYVKEKANKDDLIIITGSLYMIGDMRKIIRGIEW